MSSDPINSPPHFTYGGIETIDFLEAKLGPAGFAAYCRGNAMKYLARLGHKGDKTQAVADARKAEWYSRRLAESLERAALTEEGKT